ncbi:MAG: PilN domain-containing protein [Terriglobia bacterium]
MIKINLLGVAPPPSKMPSVGGPPAPMATQMVMFAGALIICFGIVGVIYKVWTNQIAELEKARNREKNRQSELAVVKDQNAKYQQRLKDLETRVNTIQALQNSRVGPVELMSTLGSIVNKTNDIYLYSLAPMGDRLKLNGQSTTVDSVANFLAFLKNSGSFDDVQLEQFYQDDQHERLSFKFTLSCQFKSSTGMISPTAGGASAGPGGPGTGPSGGPGGPQGAPAQAQGLKRAL